MKKSFSFLCFYTEFSFTFRLELVFVGVTKELQMFSKNFFALLLLFFYGEDYLGMFKEIFLFVKEGDFLIFVSTPMAIKPILDIFYWLPVFSLDFLGV